MVNSFLHGVKVLDLSQFIPGPYASQILADLGAEVVKVEPPRGDPMRYWGPIDSDDVSAFYKLFNGGKHVVQIDLKSPAGKESLQELIERADVLIESYRPGVMDRLGFSKEVIQSMNPRLVHCAITGFGQTGPYRLRAGYDLNYMALGGGLAISGTQKSPVMTVPPVSDFAGGLQAATTIMGALTGRAKTGTGCYLDIAMTDAVLAWQACAITSAQRQGNYVNRGQGEENGGLACYNIYRTADDHFVTIAAEDTKFWQNFCGAVKRQDWISRQWETLPQTILTRELQEMFQSEALHYWETLFDGIDCCFQPVVKPVDITDHPQVKARKLVSQQSSPDDLYQVLYPAWINSEPPKARKKYTEEDIGETLARWK